MKTYIAQADTGLHVVVRAIPAEIGEGIPQEEFVDCFNALSAARNVHELLKAIDPLPTLLNSESISGRKRIFSLEDGLSYIEKHLSPCDKEVLEQETRFVTADPFSPEAQYAMQSSPSSLRANKRGLNAAVKERGGIESSSFRKELNSGGDAIKIVIEPISDWVIAKSLFELEARTVEKLSKLNEDKTLDCPKDNILESLGFTRRFNTLSKKETWGIPFAFNPYYAPWVLEKNGIAAKFDYIFYQPLLESLLCKRDTSKVSMLRQITYWCFEEDAGIYLLTAPVAKDEYHGLFNSKEDMEDQSYYLCIEDNGRSQKELAELLVITIANAVRKLKIIADSKDKERHLEGWAWNEECVLSSDIYNSQNTYSFFADCMFRLLFRGDLKLGTCKNCGSALLDNSQGAPRSFCSAACRMRWQRHGKENIEND